MCVQLQCQKHKTFVVSYRLNPLSHVERVVNQVVKILKYDYKFFQHYVGEMMSIFYETAHAQLSADVANVLDEKMSLDTVDQRIQAAMAKFHVYREAASEITKSSIPRKMFREPWLVKAGTALAHGFFESGEASGSLEEAAYLLLYTTQYSGLTFGAS